MGDLNKPKLKLGDDGEIEGNLLLLEENPQKKKGVPRLWRRVTRNRFLVILSRVLVASLSILGCITAFTEIKSAIETSYANRCPKRVVDLNVTGDKVAFVSDASVYVMGIDGMNWQRIADPNLQPRFPVISPDGKYVAFVSAIPSGYKIYIAELGGSILRQLQLADHLQLIELAWSPDSKQIAFVANPALNKSAVDVIGVDGSNHQRVVESQGIRRVFWLGDNKTLTYLTDGSLLHIISVDGSNHRSLSLKAEYPVGLFFPSPDGKYIAFFDGVGRTIYLINSDSSNQRLWTGYPGAVGALSWSPDSSRLAATINQSKGTDIHVAHINDAQLHPTTNAAQTFTENRTPFWLPDGQHIVFSSKRIGQYETAIYIAEADGSNLQQVCARWPF